MKLSLMPTKTVVSLENRDTLVVSSYNTMFLTKKALNISKEKSKLASQDSNS